VADTQKCLECEKEKEAPQAAAEKEETKKKETPEKVVTSLVLDTKMKALFQELTAVRTNDATSKCLVFSQVSLEVCFSSSSFFLSFFLSFCLSSFFSCFIVYMMAE
jgi:hypothetical protein